MQSKMMMALVAILILTGSALADRLDSIKQKFPAGDAKSLVVNCDFAVGHLTIGPSTTEHAATVDAKYDAEYLRCDASYETRDGKGYLDLRSKGRRNHDHDGDIDNDWNVALSTKLPSDITMDIGASDLDVDLGGIPITDLNLKIGAAEGHLDFSKPNPERLREMRIDVGASSFDCESMGNANFESLRFNSGAASGLLDLRGQYSGECDITIKVGAGSLDVILPADVAVHIEADDSWLSSVDFHNENLKRLHKGVWESPGYDEAKTRMDVNIDVGIGSVDVTWKK